jgi:hypothetical protein
MTLWWVSLCRVSYFLIVMLNANMLNVVMLSVVMQNVVMLSVEAPHSHLHSNKCYILPDFLKYNLVNLVTKLELRVWILKLVPIIRVINALAYSVPELMCHTAGCKLTKLQSKILSLFCNMTLTKLCMKDFCKNFDIFWNFVFTKKNYYRKRYNL